MGMFSWFKKKKKDDGIIRIRLSGNEELDNENAFLQMGITAKEKQNEILANYTWHYLDDMDEHFECTMQLVQTEALEAAKPFFDSRNIYEERTGKKYIRKADSENFEAYDEPLLEEVDVSAIRTQVMAECEKAGFKPAKWLPVFLPLWVFPKRSPRAAVVGVRAAGLVA